MCIRDSPHFQHLNFQVVKQRTQTLVNTDEPCIPTEVRYMFTDSTLSDSLTTSWETRNTASSSPTPQVQKHSMPNALFYTLQENETVTKMSRNLELSLYAQPRPLDPFHEHYIPRMFHLTFCNNRKSVVGQRRTHPGLGIHYHLTRGRKKKITFQLRSLGA